VKKLAQELGVDELHLRYMAFPGLGRDQSDLDSSIYSYIDPKERKSWVDEFLAEPPYSMYDLIDGQYHVSQEMPHCSSFLTPLVYANGDVSVCCFDGEGQHAFGNLLSEDFKSVMSKMPAKKVYSRKLPLCSSCILSQKGMNYTTFDLSKKKVPVRDL
jgi:hypothetical protein